MNPYAPPAARVDSPTGMPPLRVQFQNSVLDLWMYQVYTQARSPVLWVVVLGFSAFLAYAVWSDADENGKTVILFMSVMMIVVGIYAVLQVLLILAWILVHRDKNFSRPRTLELTDRAVIDTTEFTRHEVQWPGIHKVLRTSWCLYLCPTALTAHCVPRRAFPDGEAFARFSSLAFELYTNAKQAG
jgi:hypothetical protein